MIQINLLPVELQEEEEHSPLRGVFVLVIIMVGVSACLLFLFLHFRKVKPQRQLLAKIQIEFQKSRGQEQEYQELSEILAYLQQRLKKNQKIENAKEDHAVKLYQLAKWLGQPLPQDPARYQYPIWLQKLTINPQGSTFVLQAQCIGVCNFLNPLVLFFKKIPVSPEFQHYFQAPINFPDFVRTALPFKEQPTGWKFDLKLLSKGRADGGKKHGQSP